MSTERFTPGPWDRESATVYISSKDGGNRFQAWFTTGFNDNGQRIDNEEVVANAALAQASPDMYAALQGAREYVALLLAERSREYAGYEGITDVPDIEACLAQIDATLAKAEGKA